MKTLISFLNRTRWFKVSGVLLTCVSFLIFDSCQKDELNPYSEDGMSPLVLANKDKPAATVGKVKDVDGNWYKTVKIGEQWWMAENLRTTRYNDKTEILNVIEDADWAVLTTPAYSWYQNDKEIYGGTYGALYNWYVADAASNGGKNVCPKGWHVASDAEWSTLASFLDPSLTTSGEKLKEVGFTHWLPPNPATNESGFTALPGGFRNNYGHFDNIGNVGYWWTATPSDPGYADMRGMDHVTPYVGSAGLMTVFGISIRCIKD